MLNIRKVLFGIGFRSVIAYLYGIFKRLNKNNKMTIFEKLLGLIVGTVDFENKELEAALEKSFASIAKVQLSSAEVDRLAGEDTTYPERAGAIVDLANVIGKAFPDLNEEEAQKVNATLATIIVADTPEKEQALENLFNDTVKAVIDLQDLNEIADLDVVPPAE